MKKVGFSVSYFFLGMVIGFVLIGLIKWKASLDESTEGFEEQSQVLTLE